MKYDNVKSSRVFNMLSDEYYKEPDFIFQSCSGCDKKTKDVDRLGTHCSHKGQIRIRNKACIERV